MLVLKRKRYEEIRIGPDVVVTVVAVESGAVRLGVTAPRGVPVHRGEVADRIASAGGPCPFCDCPEVAPTSTGPRCLSCGTAVYQPNCGGE